MDLSCIHVRTFIHPRGKDDYSIFQLKGAIKRRATLDGASEVAPPCSFFLPPPLYRTSSRPSFPRTQIVPQRKCKTRLTLHTRTTGAPYPYTLCFDVTFAEGSMASLARHRSIPAGLKAVGRARRPDRKTLFPWRTWCPGRTRRSLPSSRVRSSNQTILQGIMASSSNE